MPEKFADDSDRATALEEAERECLLSKARHASKHASLIPMGSCYYCGEEVSHPRLFCDGDCADGYERTLSAQRRNGWR